MAERGEARDDVVIEHPNREKAASKATKAIIVLLLLVTVGLMVVITVGGWDTLEGAKPVQIAYIVLYLLMAFLIARWNRGVLPVAAAFAIILLIFAAVSTPAWFDRDKTGFTDPTLDESIIGMLTFILIPVQLLLTAFALRGFAQAWNVEVERPVDEAHGARRGDAQPQPA
jgi:presenilin-like A22 family membrane protease